MRRKVLLYNPKAVFFDMPLALLLIGSALDREKYEVLIFDGRLLDDPVKEMKPHIKDAVCMGVTVLTGSPLLDALEVSREMKKLRSDLPIVWGGWHPSIFPQETLRQEKAVDVSVQQQGEVTFRELVETLDAGGDLKDVKGICYRDGDEVLQTPPRILHDMNELPAADYSLIDVEAYFKKKQRKQLDYISSTGCFFRCTFCADPFVFQRKWTALEPERMADELEHLYKKHGYTDINFQDETFFTYRKRVVAIAEEFIRRDMKVSWAGTMRADQGSRMSDEEFELCVRSGLRRVLIGVESGSQEMMDWLKKDIKMEQVWECAERCRKHNVSVIFPFIVGFPGETDKSVEQSLEMARQLREMKAEFSTPIFYFKPYPGSAITQGVVAEGYQLPETMEDWAGFDYIGSAGPWVSPDKYRLVENFKFYSKLAYRRNPFFAKPIEKLARYRCKKSWYGLPLEKWLANKLVRRPELS